MFSVPTLVSLLLLAVPKVVYADPCVTFDADFNLLAFGLNGKDWNAGQQSSWGSGEFHRHTSSLPAYPPLVGYLVPVLLPRHLRVTSRYWEISGVQTSHVVLLRCCMAVKTVGISSNLARARELFSFLNGARLASFKASGHWRPHFVCLAPLMSVL